MFFWNSLAFSMIQQMLDHRKSKRVPEKHLFLELSCFFDDPADVGNLVSGFSALSKSSLYIWKFTAHVLLKPGLENFEHHFPAKSLQSCPTLCNPVDSSPPGSPVPGILQARTQEQVVISFSNV